MFACSLCIENEELRLIAPRSEGPCERCGQVKLCFDVPAWAVKDGSLDVNESEISEYNE